MAFAVFGSAEEAARVAPSVVLACGSFDGVHAGHRALLAEAKARAAIIGAKALALTFEPHPAAVLFPDRAPAALSTLAQRLSRFEELGMDGALVLPFTKEFAALSPKRFLMSVLGAWAMDSHRHAELFSGPNWRFGQGGKGIPMDVAVLSNGRIVATEVPFVMQDGRPVSSTRVREAVADGRMDEVTRLLGAPYEILETAEPTPSRGVGTRIGAPTANVYPRSPALPPEGVYALDVTVDGSVYRAVANFGFRPTFPDARPDHPLMEIHLLDYSGEPLYGKDIAISFLRRLRDERAFSCEAELSAQIRLDIAEARKIVAVRQV